MRNNIIVSVAFLSLFILIILAWIMVSAVLVDVLTLKEIGTESVPCLDKLNRPFEDEMCEKKKTCSKFGLASEIKCSDIRKVKEVRK